MLEETKYLKQDMDRLIRELERCKNNGRITELSLSFQFLGCLMEELNIPFSEPYNLITYHRDAKEEFLNNIELHSHISKKYIETLKNNNFLYYQLTKNPIINSKEVVDLIRGCFNEVDPRIDKVIMDFLGNHQLISFADPDGMMGACHNVSAIGRNYITLPLDNKNHFSYDNMITLAHELGHVYENVIFSNRSCKQQAERYNDIYYEVISTFFENLMINYLNKNNLYRKENIFGVNTTLGTNLYFANVIKILDIADKYDLLDIDEDAFIVDDEIKKTNVDNKLYLYNEEKALETSIVEETIYLYGEILSIYYLDKYKQDGKECMKDFYNFIFNQGLMNPITLFESTGLLDDDFKSLDKYVKDNKVGMQKILLKKD